MQNGKPVSFLVTVFTVVTMSAASATEPPVVGSFEWLGTFGFDSVSAGLGVNNNGDVAGTLGNRMFAVIGDQSYTRLGQASFFAGISDAGGVAFTGNQIPRESSVWFPPSNGILLIEVSPTLTTYVVHDINSTNGISGEGFANVPGMPGETATVAFRATLTSGVRLTEPVLGRSYFGRAISESGHVAGEVSENNNVEELFIDRNGVLTNHGQVDPQGFIVGGINDSDQVVGELFEGASFDPRAFLWESGLTTSLPHLTGDSYSQALAINNAGLIAGWSSDNNQARAAIWLAEDQSVHNLNVLAESFLAAGDLIERANDVSETGWLTGVGIRGATGKREAWRIKLGGEEFVWVNEDGGSFGVEGHWDRNAVPEAGDVAVFNLSTSYAVQLDGDRELAETRVLAGDVTLDLNGAAFNGGKLTIGQPDSPASFTISGEEEIVVSVAAASALAGTAPSDPQFQTHNGTTGPNHATFGFPVLVPHGSEFKLNKSSETRFSGYVWIEGYGEVTNLASLVADELMIGDGEMGQFKVSLDGRLKANRVVLGDDQNFFSLNGGSGTLVVESQGEADFDDLLVGDGGDGTIELRSGGKLFAKNKIRMADNLGSNGTILVDGYFADPTDDANRSTLTTRSNWEIGGDGEAEVGVLNGGILTVEPNRGVLWKIHPDGSLALGNFDVPGIRSAISLPGNATVEIQIGDRGFPGSDTARMVVNEGARAVTTAIIVGPHLFESTGVDAENVPGHLIVQGLPALGLNSPGRLEVHQELVVGENGVVDVLNGGGVFIGPADRILEEMLRGTDVSDSIYVLNGGRLAVAGTINVANGITHLPGSIVCLSGCDLESGNSPGSGTINGDLVVEPGGRWTVEIAGLTPDAEYDQLIVNGDVTLGGTILFKFLDGFAPQQGQQFEFLTVSGNADLSGATFEIQNLRPGFLFDVTPNAAGFMMTALNDGHFIPEPSSFLLTCSAWAGIVARYRRRISSEKSSRSA
jgi:hypothetical protein